MSAMKKYLLYFLTLFLFAAVAPAMHAQTLAEYVIRNINWTGVPLAPTSQGANATASTISFQGPHVAFDTDYWGANHTGPGGHEGLPSPDNLFLTGWPGTRNLDQNYYQFSVSADVGYLLTLSEIQVGVATEQATAELSAFAGPTTYRLYASTTGTFDEGGYLNEVVVGNVYNDVDKFRRAVLSANLGAGFQNVEAVYFRVYAYGGAGAFGGGGIANIRDGGFEHNTAADNGDYRGAYTTPTSNVIISGAAILPSPPTVTTAAATDVTATSAVLGGNVTDAGTAPVTARGVVWGTSANPTLSNNVVTMSSGTGVFSNSVGSLSPNTTIHFRAYATNSEGTSYGANTQFTTLATVPDAPTIGTAMAGNEQATVTFTAPAFNGGAAITQYTATSNPGSITGTRGDADGPITVTGLANGTEYTFTVTATNVAGTGAASAASNAVTPIAPQTITFNQPAAQNFGSSPQLGASASSGLDVAFSSDTPAVCSVTVAGVLTFNTIGDCTIHADQAGTAAFEPAPRVTRTFAVNAVAPGAPTIGTATAGDQQVEVNFTPPASDGGQTITGYTVTSDPGGVIGTGAVSPINVTGLTNGTEYTFTVTATNGVGTGAASAASNAATPRSAQNITFEQPSDQNFGTSPQLVAAASSALDVEFSSQTPALCTVTTPGVLTFITVGTCTIDADQPGNAAWLAALTVTRSFQVLAVVPAAPTIGAATAGDQTASVSFTPPAFTGGAEILSYTVTSNPGGFTGTGAGSPVVVSNLVNGTAYTFTVTATNSVGVGAASAASGSVTPKADQTITFANPGAQDYRDTPTLSATSDSELAVVFTADAGSSAVCDITTGGLLSFSGTGSCTIHANQPGNDFFNPASQVSHTFAVQRINLAPVLTIATSLTYLEGAAALQLDANASVVDQDLDALNGGAGNYSGASLTLARSGGANTDDRFSLISGGSVSATGGPAGGGSVSAGGNVIAVMTDTGNGQLEIIFQNNGTVPTRALVIEVLRAVHYANASNVPPASVILNWVFSDGNSGADEQGTGGAMTDTAQQTVSITAVNNAPTLAATATNPTFTEDGAAALLFSAAAASTVEPGQQLTALTLTVTNVSDGTHEILVIDGSDVALTDGNAVSTATNGLSVSVAVATGTATVSFSSASLTEAEFQTLINELAYRNISQNPTVADQRVITLTQVRDSGGTANGGSDTTSLAIASSVTLLAVNDPPVVTNVNGETSTIIAGGGFQAITLMSNATVSDPDSTDFDGGFLSISQDDTTENGRWGLNGTTATSGGNGNIAGGETIAVGGVDIGTVHATNDGQQTTILRVDFNSSATPARVQTLLRALTHTAPSDFGDRVFSLTLNDGDGSANGGNPQTVVSFTLTIAPNPPVVGNLNGDTATVNVGLDQTPVNIDVGNNATVTDADSANFDGGNLTISRSGALEGNFSVDGVNVQVGGDGTIVDAETVSVNTVAIGTVEPGSDGQGSHNLVITLNSNATPARVQTLLRNLRYASDDLGTHGFTLTLTDAGVNAATSTEVSFSVSVTEPVNPDAGDVVVPGIGGNVIDSNTPANNTTGTVTITPTGVVTGGNLGGTVNNSGEIAGNVTLSPNTTINGGVISGSLTGDPQQPAQITSGTIKTGAELSNVVLGANTVLEPGVKLGPNVKFESDASIPMNTDLTGALRSVQWVSGDERQLVDLSDDILAQRENQPPVPLITSIRLIGELQGSDVGQTQAGEIRVTTDDLMSLVLPVSVSMADPGVPEGTYINDEGDIVLVTGNRRVVVAYPVLVDQPAFVSALEAIGLQLQYDARANLVVNSGGSQNASVGDGSFGIMALGVDFYYSGRPDVSALPAHRGTQPGMVEYTVEGLGGIGGISLIFETQDGRLMEQDIVPVPADWAALRAGIAAINGVSSVRIGTDGVIVVIADGVEIRGRVDFVVSRGSTAGSVMQLQLVGDVSGNGMDDYQITYTNGDRQLLFIYPIE